MNGRSNKLDQYPSSADINKAVAHARTLRSQAFHDAIGSLFNHFRRGRLNAKKPAVTSGGVYAAY